MPSAQEVEARRKEMKELFGVLAASLRRTQPSVLATLHRLQRTVNDQELESHQRDEYLIDMMMAMLHERGSGTVNDLPRDMGAKAKRMG